MKIGLVSVDTLGGNWSGCQDLVPHAGSGCQVGGVALKIGLRKGRQAGMGFKGRQAWGCGCSHACM